MGCLGPRKAHPASAAHQEHTEGVSGGSPQHKGEWVILHPVTNQAALLRGSLAPRCALHWQVTSERRVDPCLCPRIRKR